MSDAEDVVHSLANEVVGRQNAKALSVHVVNAPSALSFLASLPML